MRLGPGLSFSWRRALGISAAKGRVSRWLGVPLTRSGRQRKAGRMAGCAVLPFALLVGSCASTLDRDASPLWVLIYALAMALVVVSHAALYWRKRALNAESPAEPEPTEGEEP